MRTEQQRHLRLIYDESRLAFLANLLDELHTAASAGALESVTPLSGAELVAWLREIVYTARETMAEIEQRSADAEGLTRVK